MKRYLLHAALICGWLCLCLFVSALGSVAGGTEWWVGWTTGGTVSFIILCLVGSIGVYIGVAYGVRRGHLEEPQVGEIKVWASCPFCWWRGPINIGAPTYFTGAERRIAKACPNCGELMMLTVGKME